MTIRNRTAWPRQKGPISQRKLVPLLVGLIDAAQAPNSTAHRDLARAELRDVLATANWRTGYVLNNLASGRCRFLSNIGYAVPYQWLKDEWHGRKPEAEEA